jgi:MoaA/NifB/PqqE/SkfB family radical SAM enzyme
MAAQLRVSFIMVTNVLAHTEELREQMLYGTLTATSYPRQPKPSRQDALVIIPRIDLTPRTTEVIRRLVHGQGNVKLAGMDWNAAVHYCRFIQEGNAFVRWDGEVAPCMALLHSYPMYSLRNQKSIVSHSFGSVNAGTLAEIWDSRAYREFRERVRKWDFAPCVDCGGCEMSESNQEDCFVNPAPVCGDCLWAQGIIQCP